ncbi:hypothetical protein SAY87_014181 [Trapa incisa]|uniref:Uncharacterized protein n=1 Tax=Trapa incisa TaxID=236973 RepID=A0AAN7JKZ3_9MYRT|nr:hypothetical protein SAY87_014181 [Trapa incisa]
MQMMQVCFRSHNKWLKELRYVCKRLLGMLSGISLCVRINASKYGSRSGKRQCSGYDSDSLLADPPSQVHSRSSLYGRRCPWLGLRLGQLARGQALQSWGYSRV